MDSLTRVSIEADYFNAITAEIDTRTSSDCADIKKELSTWLKEYKKEGLDAVWQYKVVNNKKNTAYVESVYKKVRVNIPQLPEKVTFLISRSYVPNAFSMGGNVFQINYRFLARLESEAHLAYVMCHELSHQYLQHSINKVIRNIRLENDKEYKVEVKKWIKAYRKAKLEALAKTLTLS
jgi:predicted Zn-dependent protease